VEPVEIVPNTIYILPPRKEMLVSGKLLITQDKPSDQQLNFPINIFFRSLAREQKDLAIAIVLSGTGTDGSLGIQEVHAAGGLVISQNLETAKFDGMPRSAIQTGCVDACLSPEDIPELLLDYVRAPSKVLTGLRNHSQDGNEPLTGVSAVLEKLRETYDLDFSLYKSATIARRIDRRVSLGCTGIFQDYIDLVLSDNEELDRLYKDLLIGVTRFFRDSEAFDSLSRSVIPQVLDSVGEKADVKLWVPGCATGEEAYSLGILFLEACERLNRSPNIKIFATDVHRDSLLRAAEGLFSPESIEAIFPQSRRQTYFVKESTGLFRVAPKLRKLLIFSQHNLLKDPPFTRIDLVSCRNLLIYFQSPAQNKVLASFHFALKPNGFLFLGPSEGAGKLGHEFDTVDRQWKIFRKLRDVRLPMDLRNSLKEMPTRVPLQHPANLHGQLQRVYDEIMNRYMPSGILLNENRQILHIYGKASRVVKPSSGQMSTDILDLTQGDLRIAVASAIQSAVRRNERSELKGIRYHDELGNCVFNLIAEPVTAKQGGNAYLMVLLEEQPLQLQNPNEESQPRFDPDLEAHERIANLEQELQQTREALQSTIEELETSGEELQAGNEELLASNEELQSTNEELHSVNEELYSVNSEHEQKIRELNALTADWRNLLRSIDIGVIFLDNQYRIRLFSPKATEVFNLLPLDTGRDIRHITSKIPGDDFFNALERVIHSRIAEESRQNSSEGRAYLRRILPYTDNEQDGAGVVITLVDISDLSRTESALRENEARFHSMIKALGEGILLVSRTGEVLSCSDEAARMFSMNSFDMIGQSLFDQKKIQILREDGNPFPNDQSPLHQTLSSGQALRAAVMALRRQDQEDLWVIANAEPILTRGEQASAVLFCFTDITRLKRAEEQLRIAAVALEAWEGMMVTNASEVILRVNRAFSDITGFASEEVVGQTPALLHSGLQNPEFYRSLWKTLNQEGNWKGELWNRRKDGSLYPQWLTITAVPDSSGQTTHYVGTFFDISDRKQAEAKIREMAFYDTVTSLPNRRLLIDRLSQALTSSARSGQYGALLMLDLDNFKTINDVQGHAAGDRVLIEVARRLRESVRECDTVSRLGGDEFVLVLENFGSDELMATSYVEQVAGKILATLSEPYYVNISSPDERFDNSASCGIRLFCGNQIAAEELLKHADVALYQAKDAGKNNAKFFSEATQAELCRAAELSARLHEAIENGEFQLYFQPQFDRHSRIVGAEALIRWQSREGVILSPSQFIPYAEKTGLILPIGRWVLEVACKTLSEWADHPLTRSLRLAINLSARQFHRPEFYETVCRFMKQYSFNPTQLELELTESVVIDDLSEAIGKMKSLKQLGLQLALDDFGSGYSSLTYLKCLPFDRMKIDHSFVRDILTDQDDAVIVSAIIAMGKALRLEVVAEGVETEDQRQYLYRKGCRLFQGYLFSPPVPQQQFLAFLQARLKSN
jgi:two-component system CheB/CheR fusion protein